MKDKRLEKLSDILIHHSLKLKKKDLFVIEGSYRSSPLIKEVYQRALEVGANPYVRIGVEGLSEIFFKKASDSQLKFLSPISKFEIKNIDAKLGIICPENTRNMTNINPKKQAICSKAQQEIFDIFLKRAANKDLRWCLTQYPSNASAQDADMSLSEYEDFIFKAAMIDKRDPVSHWEKMYKEQEKIKNFLESKNKLHIFAKDTDLILSVNNRKWINCYGKENFPDGEVFTGPIENSIEGNISFSFPGAYGGRLVENIQLWFKKGKIIKHKSTSGEKFLDSMLNMDAGSRRIGEFAFGTNYGIKNYTKNTLFDEKIGGTIHLAAGSGYPETGSKNKSSLHWDMMCDLRKNGEVYADNELIYRNGKFIF